MADWEPPPSIRFDFGSFVVKVYEIDKCYRNGDMVLAAKEEGVILQIGSELFYNSFPVKTESLRGRNPLFSDVKESCYLPIAMAFPTTKVVDINIDDKTLRINFAKTRVLLGKMGAAFWLLHYGQQLVYDPEQELLTYENQIFDAKALVNRLVAFKRKSIPLEDFFELLNVQPRFVPLYVELAGIRLIPGPTAEVWQHRQCSIIKENGFALVQVGDKLWLNDNLLDNQLVGRVSAVVSDFCKFCFYLDYPEPPPAQPQAPPAHQPLDPPEAQPQAQIGVQLWFNVKRLLSVVFDLTKFSFQSHAQPEQSNQCVVCLDADSTHIAVPCGHFCVCEACLGVIDCPICRSQVQSWVKVFVP